MRNWRTTTSAWVAGIGAYVYFVDPSVLQVIPEPYRTLVWKGLGYLAFIGVLGTGTFASDKRPPTQPENNPEPKTP